ncbi:MFS transporter [Staphylococcus auricularis]|uniref:MFS transporter n=1 Tax=Staphylococcus auricularis TaxID=29379 RepID=UPI002DBB7225|nr:MFS transporter [Staphylococcus auricularis]MEB6571095.1 MFS transporter [Staphylococcus auricularis]
MKPFIKNIDFYLILSSLALTRISESFLGIAVLWSLYLYTDNVYLVGLLTLFQVLPIIIFSFYSGSLADSYNNKKILVTTNLSRFLLLLACGVLFYNIQSHVFNIILLYFFVFLLAVLTAFYLPSFQATIKKTVSDKRLVNANSSIEFVKHMCNIIGLLLGGILVESIGLVNTLFLGSALFLGGALIMKFAYIPSFSQKMIDKKIKGSIVESFKYLKSSSHLLQQSIYYLIIINISVAPISLIFVLLSDHLKLGSIGLSLLMISFSIGSIIRTFSAPYILKIIQENAVNFLLIVLYSIFVILTVIIPNIYLVLTLIFLTGITSSLSVIFINTFIQKETSNEFIGRVSSFRSLALRIPPPIVVMLFSYLVDAFNLIFAAILINLATIVFATLVFSKRKS